MYTHISYIYMYVYIYMWVPDSKLTQPGPPNVVPFWACQGFSVCIFNREPQGKPNLKVEVLIHSLYRTRIRQAHDSIISFIILDYVFNLSSRVPGWFGANKKHLSTDFDAGHMLCAFLSPQADI